MPEGDLIIRFGGEARELWTDAGLAVTCSGGVRLRAVAGPVGWRSSVPEGDTGGDVKSAMAERSRATELSSRINAGTAPPLTLAYFRAAADALSGASGALSGGMETLVLPETLRLLLDERGLGWDEAIAAVAGSFVCRPGGKSVRAPLGAVAALQPRTARLISAVNEKLCERLWRAFPGDWARISAAAVLRDGEVDFPALAAVMCGAIYCSKETRTTALRTLYTLWPAKFKDDDS